MSIAKFGWPTVLFAVLIYVLVQGEFTFRYPRDSGRRERQTERNR